jgi:S1-C subfamily serine protease
MTALRIIVTTALLGISFTGGFFFKDLIYGNKRALQKENTHPSIRKVNYPARASAPFRRNNVFVKAVKSASRSVAFIGVTQIQVYSNPFFNDPFFRQFFPPSVREYKSMGSGVIVTKNGYIVTNYHVVKHASKIEVHLQNGKKYIAKIQGADPYTDLAVIKIKARNLPAIKMCPNDSIYIGEWVMAIGNPFGAMIKDNRPTVTMGVVSAVGREFTRESGIGSKYKNMIQTDAAINPGNSGGALINCYGELIGINTFIFTQNNSGSVGVGFAIPAERVRKTLKEVIRYGKIRSFYTGISVQDIDQIMAQSLGLDTRKGVIVNNIEKRSPGAKAGLKVGDVILHVNQYEITNSDVIAEVFNQFLPGDKIRLEIMRGKKRRTVTLKLESKEQERTGQGK